MHRDTVPLSRSYLFVLGTVHRVWKGFCVIWDSAEIEVVIREYRENPAVIREFCVSCDVGFSLSVVRDSWFPLGKFRDLKDLTGWDKRWKNQILAILKH